VTPQEPGSEPLLPDDVRWELMTHGGALTNSVGTWQRILSWAHDVAGEQTVRSSASRTLEFPGVDMFSPAYMV